MGRVKIISDRCKGCGLCVHFCPKHGLELSEGINEWGFHPAQQLEPSECNACLSCALVCPEICIEVYRESGKDGEEVP